MAIDGVNGPVNTGRRRFLTATTAVVGAVGAGIAAVPFIKSWNPSARAKLAGAPVTADISGLQEGQRLILEWRGQPIWIVKRSQAVLQALPTLNDSVMFPRTSRQGMPDSAGVQCRPSGLVPTPIFEPAPGFSRTIVPTMRERVIWMSFPSQSMT